MGKWDGSVSGIVLPWAVYSQAGLLVGVYAGSGQSSEVGGEERG